MARKFVSMIVYQYDYDYDEHDKLIIKIVNYSFDTFMI